MNGSAIQNLLQECISGGVLTLRAEANQLGSPRIDALLTGSFNGVLTVTPGDAQVGSDSVVYPQASLQSESFSFYPVAQSVASVLTVSTGKDGTLDLSLSATMPSGWALTDSFPAIGALKNSPLQKIDAASAVIVVASADSATNAVITATLTTARSSLGRLTWLLGDTVQVSGAAGFVADPNKVAHPVLSLRSSKISGPDISGFSFDVFLNLRSAAGPPSIASGAWPLLTGVDLTVSLVTPGLTLPILIGITGPDQSLYPVSLDHYVPAPAITELAQLEGFTWNQRIALSAHTPIGTLSLRALSMVFDAANRTLSALQVTVALGTDWTIVDNLKLAGLQAQLNLPVLWGGNPPSPDPAFSIAVTAEFVLANTRLDATITYPAETVALALAPGTALDIDAFLNALSPGVSLPGSGNLTIDELGAIADIPRNRYQISASAHGNLSVIPHFVLTGIDMNVEWADGKLEAFQFGAGFIIAKAPLYLCAIYAADAWTIAGGSAPGQQISMTDLVVDIAGIFGVELPSTLPQIVLSSLNMTYHTANGSFTFDAAIAYVNERDPVLSKISGTVNIAYNGEAKTWTGEVSAKLTVEDIFSKSYTFQGSLTFTSQLMTGTLSVAPQSKPEDAKISSPFQLPGIEIDHLKMQVTGVLGGGPATPTFELLGHTRLGRPPERGAQDQRAVFDVRLGLAKGKPALMSIVLDKDLSVGGFLAQCFTGDSRNWLSNFIELTFKGGSRAYYYAPLDESEIWQTEPAYEPGFNIDVHTELAVGGNNPIRFDFKLQSRLDANGKPVSLEKASARLMSPVQLWFIELAGSDQSGDGPYTGGPAFEIDPQNSKFTLKVGVNFFGGALGSADVAISRQGEDTRLEGEVRSAKSLDGLGYLSFHFTYTHKGDGNHTLAISKWPAFETAEQLIDIVTRIKELANAAEGTGCGDLAAYTADKVLHTKYSISPSVDMSGNKPKFSVTLTCSMHFGSPNGQLVMTWNPVTIPIELPDNTTLNELAEKLLQGITNAGVETVRALLLQTDKIALFLAITFGEKAGAYVVDLLCRRPAASGGGARAPLISLSVPALVATPAVAEIVGSGGLAALFAAGTAAALAKLANLARELKEKTGSDTPSASDPNKLAKPVVSLFEFTGSALHAEWTAVAFAGRYEYELTGPSGFRSRTDQITETEIKDASGPFLVGAYALRVRAVRGTVGGSLEGEWSDARALTLEKLVAPAVRLAYVASPSEGHLEATWSPLTGGPRTYEVELLLDGTPVQPNPEPTRDGRLRWPLAGRPSGIYTVRIRVQGVEPKYIASDWSSASNPVVKLAAPVAQKLTFSDDQVHLSWQSQGDAAGIAFDARLVPTGIAGSPSATGVDFDSATLAVGTYHAETQARPQPASPNTAPSDWSPRLACTIAKLSPPQIASVAQAGSQAAPSIDVSIASTVAGADVYYARLFYAGTTPGPVEFQPNRVEPNQVATFPLPADYHGLMQVEVRAAKRDGSAIASNWDRHAISRLTPPTGVTCTYDHDKKRAVLSFSAATPFVAATVSLSYEIQLFAGTPLELFGQHRVEHGPDRIEVEDLFRSVAASAGGKIVPAGPVRVQVRTVAADDRYFLLPSVWCVVELRKLGTAVVTDVSYERVPAEHVRVKLADAGPGIIYEVSFDITVGVNGRASEPEIECSIPFAAGATGSLTVSARLTSTDPAVIDGRWKADPAFTLTKFPAPSNPVLVWDDDNGALSVRFTPSPGIERHEVQLFANDRSVGDVLSIDPNSAAKRIPLDHNLDHNLPAGSIGVQVRSNGPAPRAIPGDWVRSSVLDRPGQYAQPRLSYMTVEDEIVAEWDPSATRIRLAAQLLSGQATRISGGVLVVDAPARTPLRTVLTFGQELTPGMHWVRFRTILLTESALPGVWTTSTQTLRRLSAPRDVVAFTQGEDGVGVRCDSDSYDFQLLEEGVPFGPIATGGKSQSPALLHTNNLGLHPGVYEVRVRAKGIDDKTIPSVWTRAGNSIRKAATPQIVSLEARSDAVVVEIVKFGVDGETYDAHAQFVTLVGGEPVGPLLEGKHTVHPIAAGRFIIFPTKGEGVPPGTYKVRVKVRRTGSDGLDSEWGLSTGTIHKPTTPRIDSLEASPGAIVVGMWLSVVNVETFDAHAQFVNSVGGEPGGPILEGKLTLYPLYPPRPGLSPAHGTISFPTKGEDIPPGTYKVRVKVRRTGNDGLDSEWGLSTGTIHKPTTPRIVSLEASPGAVLVGMQISVVNVETYDAHAQLVNSEGGEPVDPIMEGKQTFYPPRPGLSPAHSTIGFAIKGVPRGTYKVRVKVRHTGNDGLDSEWGLSTGTITVIASG